MNPVNRLIACVDDEENNRALLDGLFSIPGRLPEGTEFKAVETPEELRTHLIETKQSLALLIADMTGVDWGPGGVIGFRSTFATMFPILVVTGHGRDLFGDIVDKPHVEFFPKPFSPKLLAQKVRDMIAAFEARS